MQLKSFDGFNFDGYRFPMIVVYNDPSDFPGKFVARVFDIPPAFRGMVISEPIRTPFHVVADNLRDIRMSIPSGFIQRDRDPEDDPVIVEVWF